jgi:hypothetical protein
MDEVAGNRTMRDVAEMIEPTMSVVSTSNPEPSLQTLNIVAVYHAENDARNAVLGLESIEAADGSVGLTVLGTQEPTAPRTPNDDATIRGLDPEGVTADIVPRAIKGAIIGAIVGAVVVGGAAALITEEAAAIGGALGGLLMGAAIGAIWAAFVRMGGSDAYRQTFVESSKMELMLVSLHTADGATAERARQLLAANADREPYVVRSDDDGLHVI